MKKNEVQVGGRYLAKVSGVLTKVRVTEIQELEPSSWSRTSTRRTLYQAVNEATGRRITIRSAQRLRPLPRAACAFCELKANRREGNFTCPYCGKEWRTE